MVDIMKSLKKPEPLAAKAEEQELPMVPKAPNIAEALGGTPKQAQMAPTPQAAQGEAKRQNQKAQRSAQLEQQQARPVDEKTLSDFNTQAEGMIAKLANLQSGAQKAFTEGLEGPVKTQAQTGADMLTAMGEAESADAVTETTLTEDAKADIKGSIVGGESNLGQAGTITVAEIDDPEITAFAESVGLGPDASLEELKAAVSEQTAQITQVVDTQREIMNDPNATPAERQQSMQLMRDYGASHMLATDAELDKFEEDISSVGVIEFNGQMVPLAEVADNEMVTSILITAADTLMNNPNATAKELGLDKHPELYNFVKNNTAAVVSTLDQEKENLAGVQEQVSKNLEISDNMPEGIAETLGFTTFGDNSKLDQEVLSIFTADGPNIGDHTSEDIRNAIASINEVNPGLVKELLKDGKSLRTGVKKFMEKADTYDAVQKAGSPEDVIKAMTGIPDLDTAQNLLSEIKRYPGHFSEEEKRHYTQLLDANHDGKVDDYDQLRERALNTSLKYGKLTPPTSYVGKKTKEVEELKVPDLVSRIQNTKFTEDATLNTAALSDLTTAKGKLDEITSKNPRLMKEPGIKEAYDQIAGLLWHVMDSKNNLENEALYQKTQTQEPKELSKTKPSATHSAALGGISTYDTSDLSVDNTANDLPNLGASFDTKYSGKPKKKPEKKYVAPEKDKKSMRGAR